MDSRDYYYLEWPVVRLLKRRSPHRFFPAQTARLNGSVEVALNYSHTLSYSYSKPVLLDQVQYMDFKLLHVIFITFRWHWLSVVAGRPAVHPGRLVSVLYPAATARSPACERSGRISKRNTINSANLLYAVDEDDRPD